MLMVFPELYTVSLHSSFERYDQRVCVHGKLGRTPRHEPAPGLSAPLAGVCSGAAHVSVRPAHSASQSGKSLLSALCSFS